MDTPAEILQIMQAITKADDTVWFNDHETVFERLQWLYGECGGDMSILEREFPECQ